MGLEIFKKMWVEGDGFWGIRAGEWMQGKGCEGEGKFKGNGLGVVVGEEER